jgi:hypothetical protein
MKFNMHNCSAPIWQCISSSLFVFQASSSGLCIFWNQSFDFMEVEIQFLIWAVSEVNIQTWCTYLPFSAYLDWQLLSEILYDNNFGKSYTVDLKVDYL